MEVKKYGAGIFTVSNFLTKEECQRKILRAEKQGYEDATIQTREGPVRAEKVRNNDRVIFDDESLAQMFYARAKGFLPAIQDDWLITGLNEKFRFYKYGSGQYFKFHKDGSFQRSSTEESMLTFIVYLNDDFEGGLTRFLWDKVKPEEGMLIVFPHRITHEGSEVTSGYKYALRTDVMYCKNQ